MCVLIEVLESVSPFARKRQPSVVMQPESANLQIDSSAALSFLLIESVSDRSDDWTVWTPVLWRITPPSGVQAGKHREPLLGQLWCQCTDVRREAASTNSANSHEQSS
jgi:hypothetical protein